MGNFDPFCAFDTNRGHIYNIQIYVQSDITEKLNVSVV